jgi:hypothetical protein
MNTYRSYGAYNGMELFFYKQIAPTEQQVKMQDNFYFKIKQRIEHSEEKINQLVYELYNLTEKEIAIIENSNKY